MNYLFAPVLLNQYLFRKIKQGVLQFVVIKPVTAILSLILIYFDLYNEGDFNLKQSYIYLSVINNFSALVFNFR